MVGAEQEVELISVTNGNPDTFSAFMRLGRDYLSDLPSDERESFIQSILARQEEPDRWLLLLKYREEYLGLAHMKIDRDERPGWGFILEFYIVPNRRKLGWGRKLFNLLVKILLVRGVKNIWLLTNLRAEKFWFSLGFKDTGEIDKETGQKILATSV